MRTLLRALLLVSACLPAKAQETRIWDLNGLRHGEEVARAGRIGFRPREARTGTVRRFIGEDITAWVRVRTWGCDWDVPPRVMEWQNGFLIVQAEEKEFAGVEAALVPLIRLVSRSVEMEIEVHEVAPEIAAKLAPGPVPAGPLAGLRDAARARLLDRLVARAPVGRYGHAESVRRRTFIADADIQVAQGAVVPDPASGTLLLGSQVEFLPQVRSDGSVALDLFYESCGLAGLEAFALPSASGGRIDLPRLDCVEIRTRVTADPGETLLVSASTHRPATPGWTTVVLVRATVCVGPGDAEKPGDDVAAALYDVGMLLDLPGDTGQPPAFGLPDPADSGDRPSASDPMPTDTSLFDGEKLGDLLKTNSGETRWDEDGQVLAVLGPFAIVRASEQTRGAILAEIGRLEAAAGPDCAVQSWLLAFPESEWLTRREEIQRPKGIPDALFEDLLQLPSAGTVRLVGTSSALGRLGTRFYAARGRRQAFVARYGVDVAEEARAWDPEVENVLDGVVVDALVDRASDGLYRVRSESALAEATIGAPVDTGAEAGGKVHVPACLRMTLGCDAMLAEGRAMVTGSAVREGSAGREIWVNFVRVRALAEK